MQNEEKLVCDNGKYAKISTKFSFYQNYESPKVYVYLMLMINSLGLNDTVMCQSTRLSLS